MKAGPRHTESELQHSKQVVGFLSGSSMSLRNEIVGLISILAYRLHSLNMEAERLIKLQDDDLNEFALLIKSARDKM